MYGVCVWGGGGKEFDRIPEKEPFVINTNFWQFSSYHHSHTNSLRLDSWFIGTQTLLLKSVPIFLVEMVLQSDG